VNGIFTTGTESTAAVTEAPMRSPVAKSPHMPVLNVEDVLQLDLFGGHARAMEVIAVNWIRQNGFLLVRYLYSAHRGHESKVYSAHR
jgi:hypothetical protein